MRVQVLVSRPASYLAQQDSIEDFFHKIYFDSILSTHSFIQDSISPYPPQFHVPQDTRNPKNTKHTQSTHRIGFVLGNYSRAWALPWSAVDIPSVKLHWREPVFPLSSVTIAGSPQIVPTPNQEAMCPLVLHSRVVWLETC